MERSGGPSARSREGRGKLRPAAGLCPPSLLCFAYTPVKRRQDGTIAREQQGEAKCALTVPNAVAPLRLGPRICQQVSSVPKSASGLAPSPPRGRGLLPSPCFCAEAVTRLLEACPRLCPKAWRGNRPPGGSRPHSRVKGGAGAPRKPETSLARCCARAPRAATKLLPHNKTVQ